MKGLCESNGGSKLALLAGPGPRRGGAGAREDQRVIHPDDASDGRSRASWRRLGRSNRRRPGDSARRSEKTRGGSAPCDGTGVRRLHHLLHLSRDLQRRLSARDGHGGPPGPLLHDLPVLFPADRPALAARLDLPRVPDPLGARRLPGHLLLLPEGLLPGLLPRPGRLRRGGARRASAASGGGGITRGRRGS